MKIKEIIINTQEEFDKIKIIKVDEKIIFESMKIKINCILEVFGILKLKGEIDSSWDNRYIISRESSQNHIISRESSQNHIISWESSQNHIISWESSQNHIESWNRSVNTVINFITSIILNGFSAVLMPFDLKIKIKKNKTSIIQRYKTENEYLKREGVLINKNKIVLYKKVSENFKTQENTKNETLWNLLTVVEHPNWKPETTECGEGKFHACSRPYFCDEFRDMLKDKYIAIEIQVKDLYEWKNPQFPHKIAFKKGKVLYECDKYGNKLN